MDQETAYLLQPTVFHSILDVQELANTFEQTLHAQRP